MSGFWTKARDERLFTEWPEFSAAEIAEHLGTSRNAVIGRYHRLRRTAFSYLDREATERRVRAEVRRQTATAANRRAINALHAAIEAGTPRRDAIKLARESGGSWLAIAAACGVSRQRIHQLLTARRFATGMHPSRRGENNSGGT